MVYHGISWYIMVYHGISWYIMVYIMVFYVFFMVFFMANLSHFGHSSAGSEVAADKGFARCDR